MNKTAIACALFGCCIGFAAGYGAGGAVGEAKTLEKVRLADAKKDAWMRKIVHVCNWADIVARDHCSVPLPHTVAE